MGVKTVKEAIALKEITFGELLEQPLCLTGVEGDDIILFSDENGDAWQVEDTINGPRKMRFSL